MEFLELSGSGDFAALGTMLAALHRKAADRFGWSRDNFIGATPQANGGGEGLAEVLVERRLEPQLALPRQKWLSVAPPGVLEMLARPPTQAAPVRCEPLSGHCR